MKTTNKKFDAVKMMREIRDELYIEYSKNPKKFKENLTIVRDKYATSGTNKRKRKTA